MFMQDRRSEAVSGQTRKERVKTPSTNNAAENGQWESPEESELMLKKGLCARTEGIDFSGAAVGRSMNSELAKNCDRQHSAE